MSRNKQEQLDEFLFILDEFISDKINDGYSKRNPEGSWFGYSADGSQKELRKVLAKLLDIETFE